MLFVPAATPRHWHKAHTRGADAIILDLEDSTQPEAKSAARALAASAVSTMLANEIETTFDLYMTARLCSAIEGRSERATGWNKQ